MFGGGGHLRQGHYIPYYICSKRQRQKACDLPYVRSDHLEHALIEDLKTAFLDKAMLQKLWEKAKVKHDEAVQQVKDELVAVKALITDNRTRLNRYLNAFEAGTLDSLTCNKKAEELSQAICQLEETQKDLEAQAERLGLAPLDHDHFKSRIEDLESVLRTAPVPKVKALLKQLVVSVKLKGKREAEVVYRLQIRPKFDTLEQVAPRVGLEPTT